MANFDQIYIFEISVKRQIFYTVPHSAKFYVVEGSVADPDPGSGAFLTPESVIRNG